MAKFGIDATKVSDPGLGGAGFIASGVMDESGAIRTKATTGLIANAGSMAIEAYQGKQLADIEVEQEKVIQEYMDRKNPEMLKIEAAALKQQDISLFQQPGVTPEELAPVQQKFNETLSRYKNALDQGLMSPEEFNTRTITVLRNAVNKNPGLMKDLSDQATKVLELSGIQGIIKSDISDREKLAKASENAINYDMEIAKKFNIVVPYNNDGSVNLASLRKKNAIVQQEQFVVEQADRLDKFTEDQVRDYGTPLMNGKINNATDMSIQILNDPAITVDKALFQINNLLDSVQQGFVSDPRVGRIIDKPAVQSMMTYGKTQIDAIKENLKKFATKEEAAAYLKNTTNMLRDSQYQTISQVVNPQAVELLSKLTANVHFANVLDKHPELAVNMMGNLSRVIEGLPTNGTVLYDRLPEGGKSPIMNTLSSLAIDAGKDGGGKSITGLANTIKTINIDSQRMSPQQKYSLYGDYIKELGNPANKIGISKLDDVAIGQATESLSDYMKMTTTDFLSSVQAYRDKGIQISIDPLPDGRISLSTSDPKVTEELTKKHIIRINDSLNAYASLTNSNTSNIAPKFYSSFMGIKPTFTRESNNVVSGVIR
ncbi:hypothetical protein [Caudoviricetes sp.]|nr:hypothetical protein [Caudoviricetes sp.]